MIIFRKIIDLEHKMHYGFLNLIFLFAFSVSLFNAERTSSQTSFYDIGQLQNMEIYFSQSNWDYQMDTAKIGADSYIMADWIKINEVFFDSVGIKYKGNSSYDSSYLKNPIHISLDKFKSQAYQGYTDIKLNNGHSDPSMIREVLAYKILSNYMDCPGSNFCQVYINNQYIGLYTNVQNVDKEFCSDNYYSSDGIFIKANPKVPGPYTRSNLKYISNDSSDYFDLYEIKSDYGWNDLVTLCNLTTNYADWIDSVYDIDKVLWMLAFNNVLVNLDSYSGAFAQNYYLFKDTHNQYNSLIWDLNMSFGGFPFAGLQGGGMGSLSVNDMQNLPISLHFSDADWPLIKNTMNNNEFRKMYHAHLRTIVSEYFANQDYLILAQQLQALIDTAVFSDVNKFFTYEQFLGGLTSSILFGSYTIPGIEVLMDERRDFFQNSTEFSYILPNISSVTPENINPEINSIVFISANVTDADPGSVFLGYRYNNADNFLKTQMYDDGLHHDGQSSDLIYGVSVEMQSEWLDYYIYAENNEAGIFSPERAEHEYYSLKANITTPQLGDILINEFLAINQNDTVDESGENEDWIELYNITNLSINLYGLYLTDDFSNPKKFAFMQNSIIQPHNFLVIWADEDSSTSASIHCNFKLSGNGEEIMLSNIDGVILDSLTFGSQVPDYSMGRCPDGSDSMIILPNTTFSASNCESGIDSYLASNNSLSVYPNPASKYFYIRDDNPLIEKKIVIYNILGKKCFASVLKDFIFIETEDWNPGIYMIVSNNIESMIILINP